MTHDGKDGLTAQKWSFKVDVEMKVKSLFIKLQIGSALDDAGTANKTRNVMMARLFVEGCDLRLMIACICFHKGTRARWQVIKTAT